MATRIDLGNVIGPQGPQGIKGDKGDKGDSVTVLSVSESTADNGNNIIEFSDGKQIAIKNGSKGSQGVKGDTFTYADLTDEELEELKQNITTINKQFKSTYNVTSATSTIPINIYEYTNGVDMLEVFINGLRLVEGVDYSVSGSNIVLTKELETIGQVHFICTKSIGTTTAEFELLKGVKGDKGDQGIQGIQGEKGLDGLSVNRVFSGTYEVGGTSSLSPTEFNRTPVVGDFFITVDGSSYLDVFQVTSVSSSSVAFKCVSRKNIKGDKGSDGNPIGTILSYVGSTAPTGYLLCNGATYNTTTYSELYKLLGTNVLPDLRGRFLQGANGNLKQKIEAGLPNITGYHHSQGSDSGNEATGAFKVRTTGKVDSGSSSASNYINSVDFDASRSSSIYGNSDTVQPPAYTVNYIIKAT